MPIISPERHTSRHRRRVLGGRTKVNCAGRAFAVEIETHAPPADTLFSMPRAQGDPSSNIILTIWLFGSRGLRRLSIGKEEKRATPIRSPQAVLPNKHNTER
jgi:hypothetical protein